MSENENPSKADIFDDYFDDDNDVKDNKMSDKLNISERFYCVLEDLKDYNHNKNDKEIDFIIDQMEEIKKLWNGSVE